LLRFMAQGYRAETYELTGSLERAIESAILRYGLNYTIEFVRQLSIDCQQRVQALTDERNQKQARRRDLDAEIEDAKSECLSARREREKQSALNKLYTVLREDISLAGETDTIEQQIRILNDLSQGESGILDDYRHRLEALKLLVQERLEGKQESGETTGLADIYKINLPERFVATQQEVTTTYLPDVASFVAGRTWRKEHLFSSLYRNLVEQARLPSGGEEPLRYGEDYGRDPERQGLHRALWQMLTDRGITGIDGGYEREGEVAFFQRFFGRQNPQEVSTAVVQLENFARGYIQRMLQTSDEIREELNRPLIDRFNAIPDNAEKQRIKDKFSDKGTQTFCRMIGRTGAQPTTYNVYAGNNQALAQVLGFVPDNNQYQFVFEDTPNRLLKIKVQTRHTLKGYPHYPVYSQIYNQFREEKLYPHIHKDFNLYGVWNAMQPPPEESELLDLFVQTLLYREMFEIAYQQQNDLVDALIHQDLRLTGEQETEVSPLIVEEEGERVVAYLCSKIAIKNNKLVLERGNYERVDSDVLDFKTIYDGFHRSSERPAIQEALEQFDKHFRQGATSLWLDILPQAREQLEEKVKDGLGEPDEVGTFYKELNNHLVTIGDELQSHLQQAPSALTQPTPTLQRKKLRV